MKFGSLTPAFSVPNPSKMAILLCSAETVDARRTYIWLKDTTVGCSTAVEIAHLNSQDCGNAVPNQFIQPRQLFQPLFT